MWFKFTLIFIRIGWYRELMMQGGDRALEESDTRREHDVVDIEEVDGVVATPMDEQGRVRLGFDESSGDQVESEATVPSPRCLIEVIQRAVSTYTPCPGEWSR
jgi:hypothetical protein